eukprot:847244-Alexandrium_andersonii.AAC.1
MCIRDRSLARKHSAFPCACARLRDFACAPSLGRVSRASPLPARLRRAARLCPRACAGPSLARFAFARAPAPGCEA